MRSEGHLLRWTLTIIWTSTCQVQKKNHGWQCCKTLKRLTELWLKTSSRINSLNQNSNLGSQRTCFKRKSKRTKQPQRWPWLWKRCTLLVTLWAHFRKLVLLRSTKTWTWPEAWWSTIPGLCHTKELAKTWIRLCTAHPSLTRETRVLLMGPRCLSRTSLRLALT